MNTNDKFEDATSYGYTNNDHCSTASPVGAAAANNATGPSASSSSSAVTQTPSQTLFSAVMSRSGSGEKNKQQRNVGLGGGASLLGKVLDCAKNWDRSDNKSDAGSAKADNDITPGANNVTFSTGTPVLSPSRKALFKRQLSPRKSPGGYDIIKALDGVTDFSQAFYNMGDMDDEEDDDDAASTHHDSHRVAHVYLRRKTVRANISLETKRDNTDGEDNELFEKTNSNPLHSIVEETTPAFDTTTFKQMNTSFYQEPVSLGLMDWSLKKRVRLLCSPGRCLPGSFASSFGGGNMVLPPDEGVVQQLASMFLLNVDGGMAKQFYGREPSAEEVAMAKWMAGTMYYQHPAVHPLPSSVLLETKMPSAPHQDLSSFNDRSMYHRVRLPGVGSMGGMGISTYDVGRKINPRVGSIIATKQSVESSLVTSVANLLDKRRREWQGAFRSMYHTWLSKLKNLEYRGGTPQSFVGKKSAATPDEIARCSFYSILPSQVILFRGSVGSFDQADANERKHISVVPVIVFSSTTAELRTKLRCMGVALKVLSPNETTDFSEDMLETKNQQSKSATGANDKDSESVKAELQALRTANGAGAEVSVAQKKKNRGSGDISKESSLPPLYVNGEDDCAVVYEILLNTFGLSKLATQPTSDVPLLLCRSIGSCLHTTLQTLSISARRDCAYWDQTMSSQAPTQEPESVMELYGPILPCALRDLACASINWMMLDKHWHDQRLVYDAYNAPTQAENFDEKKTEEDATDNEGGTHRITILLQAHEGEQTVSEATSTGSSSSSFFNGSNATFSLSANDGGKGTGATATWQECNAGETLNALIWDVEHSSDLEYTTFHIHES